MWSLLGLLAAWSLVPAQAGELQLTNQRTTYGVLGPTRPSEGKLSPGDAFSVAFDIENLRANDDGEVLYSMAMELTDSKGKIQFKQDPSQLKALNTLGGHRLPAFAQVDIGFEQPSGQYNLKVTVTDRRTKKEKSFTRPFEVGPAAFGLVRLSTSSDPGGQIAAPTIGVPGQSVWVHFYTVGFKRGAKDEPNLAVEMRLYDEKNEPTLPKPIPGEIKELPKGVNAVPWDFVLVLNRPGKFTAKLKAIDRVANKTAELSFPVTVLDMK
jgi:hypothetical protein